MREIFYELISEAVNAKVVLDGEEWPIGFNHVINDKYDGNENNISTLVIDNEVEFFKYLEIYVNKELKMNRKYVRFSDNDERTRIKAIMAYLLINMSTEDFLHPIEYLKRRIAFLDDTTFSLLDESYDFPVTDNARLEIKQGIQSIYLETPYVINMSVKTDKQEYKLPHISYGVVEEDGVKTCYVYGISKYRMNSEEFVRNKDLIKLVNKYLNKYNSGVYASESQEYKDYKRGRSDYYAENISDLRPAFVFSLLTFFKLLTAKGVERVKVVSYLPLRYESLESMKNDPNERKSRVDRIQRGFTDRFLRTFRRVAFHLENLEITGYPYELDEYLTISIKKPKKEQAIVTMLDSETEEKAAAMEYVAGTNGLENIEISEGEMFRILEEAQNGRNAKSFLYELVKRLEDKRRESIGVDSDGRRKL